MIYIIISLIIIAALIYLTVAASKKSAKLRKYRLINILLGSLGALTVIGSYLTGYLLINNSKNDPEWASWASDMFNIYFDLTVKVLLILLIAVIVSSLLSLTNKKSRGGFFRKIRLITPIAISALLLIITYFYAPATSNTVLPLQVFVYLAGIGEALVMRFAYAIEYTIDIKTEN